MTRYVIPICAYCYEIGAIKKATHRADRPELGETNDICDDCVVLFNEVGKHIVMPLDLDEDGVLEVG